MSDLVLPVSTANAKLPQVYEEAKIALANCVSIDECKDWADKAAAIASYARQADDQTLHKYADRIQARAVRRCGELLKLFKAQGARTDQPTLAGGPSPKSQKAAANGAGLSPDQAKKAVRVANVPQWTFDDIVESENPPSVTKIARMGTAPAPAGFKQATHLLGTVRRFAEFCAANDAALVANGVMDYERADAKRLISQIDAWLDRFVVNLGDEE